MVCQLSHYNSLIEDIILMEFNRNNITVENFHSLRKKSKFSSEPEKMIICSLLSLNDRKNNNKRALSWVEKYGASEFYEWPNIIAHLEYCINSYKNNNLKGISMLYNAEEKTEGISKTLTSFLIFSILTENEESDCKPNLDDLKVDKELSNQPQILSKLIDFYINTIQKKDGLK